MNLMSSILTPYPDKLVIIYLDDIPIYNDTEYEHVKYLRNGTGRLTENILYAKRSKCSFGVTGREYLGFILKGDGVEINPQKRQLSDTVQVLSQKMMYNPS